MRFGPCGHPLRGYGCHVCSLLRLESVECYGYMDDQVYTHRSRSIVANEWAGREDEANAYRYQHSASGNVYMMRNDEDAQYAESDIRRLSREEARRSEQGLGERTMSACCEHIGHTRLEVDATIARICPPESRGAKTTVGIVRTLTIGGHAMPLAIVPSGSTFSTDDYQPVVLRNGDVVGFTGCPSVECSRDGVYSVRAINSGPRPGLHVQRIAEHPDFY